ncbi:MAG: T9SS type A sorting domain-containing protein [Bacteroidia bacterium]
MKKYVLSGLLMTLLVTIGFTAQAQNPRNFFIAHDLDSAGYEWTAMEHTINDFLVISTLPEGSSMTPATGPLRMRVYGGFHNAASIQTNTYRFTGKFRVMNMTAVDDQLLVTGGYHDSCFIAGDTLVGLEPFALDPFIGAFNPQTGAFDWIWHDARLQNNYFHRLRVDHDNQQVIASGLADDVSGWLAAFDLQNGQKIWEKQFPGVRTLSDARPDPQFPGSLVITGTIADNGFINQVPVPVTTPGTGYRCFAARYYPATDSVVFLHSVPYITFDFEPSLQLQAYPGSLPELFWSAPMVNPTAGSMLQLRISVHNPSITDTIAHDMFFTEAEQYVPSRLGNFQLFKTPGINPNLYTLNAIQIDANNSFSYTVAQLGFSAGSPQAVLTHVGGPVLRLAFKSTGHVDVNMIGFHLWRDSTLIFPNASPSQPKWVLLTTGFILSSLAEKSPVHFTVFPNPTGSEGFQIKTEAPIDQAARWYLRDLQGRLVMEGRLNEATELIPTSGMAAGLYFFELHTQQGSGMQKVVIR